MQKPEPRFCPQCGSELVRKSNESPRDFNRRQFCDRECLHASLIVDTPPKTCPQCGELFERKKGISIKTFANTMACSTKCAQLYRSKNGTYTYVAPLPMPEPKVCLGCGQTFAIQKGQKPSHFAELRFCSRQCAAQYRVRDKRITHVCACCGKDFETSQSHTRYHPTKYCSNECAIAATMRGIPKSEEHKRKNSESLTGLVKSPAHCAHLSIAAKKRFADPEERKKNGIAASKGMLNPAVTQKLRVNGMKGLRKMALAGQIGSKPELALRAALDLRAISYLHHLPIENIGIPDLCFAEHKLIVQVDGEYWHLLSQVVERDNRQDKKYRKLGYTVLRFWASEVLDDADRCADRIVKVLNDLTPAMPSR